MKPSEKGFSMVVEHLLENGANPNLADKVSCYTQIYENTDSCEYGHQLVQFNNSVAPIPPIF